MSRLYCPLCDAPMEGAWCARHRVPAIHLEGPRGPIERLEVGTTLVGRYRIDGLLQQGGMGVLLEATRLPDREKVVIKVLKGQRVHDRANVRRFYQEARVASSLDHPNVVRIHEFGVDEATRAPFLAMELVVGRTLKALVAREGPLPERRAAALFAQVSHALVAAHAEGVLHRDLKPSNIMVRPGIEVPEEVKVLDFGLAKIVDDASIAPLTQPGKTVGTPAFMSPEQVTQRPQDFRSDLYGLGCVLYATVAGAAPFVGEDLVTVMRHQIRTPPPRLPEVLADGAAPSEALIRLYRSLMEKAPEDRPRSTEAVAEAFEALAVRADASPPLLETVPRERAASLGATLISAPPLFDTDPSLKTEAPPLPSVDSSSDPSALTDGLFDDSSGARTALDAPGLETELESVHEGDDEEAEDRTPLDIEGLHLEPLATSTDDLLTSVQPQGLDETSDPFAGTADGPVLGASLLVARPWPTDLDARPTRPLEPAHPRIDSGAVTVKPSRAPRAASWADPAEQARGQPPARTQGLMFGVLIIAAVLVGLAAGAVWLRPSQTTAGAPRQARPPTPEVEPRAQPRGGERDSSLGVRLETRPDGARVEVGGVMRGRTPLWLPRPTPGATMQVVLRREGYADRALSLSAEGPTVVEVTLEPAP